MDEIQDQMDGIEEDSETVKELYALVDQYQVPVNPEDLAVYQVSNDLGLISKVLIDSMPRVMW